MINSINLPTEALQGRYYIIVVILEIMFENVSVSWHLGGWDEPENSSEINGHTFRATPSRDTWGFEFTGKIQQVRYILCVQKKFGVKLPSCYWVANDFQNQFMKLCGMPWWPSCLMCKFKKTLFLFLIQNDGHQQCTMVPIIVT